MHVARPLAAATIRPGQPDWSHFVPTGDVRQGDGMFMLDGTLPRPATLVIRDGRAWATFHDFMGPGSAPIGMMEGMALAAVLSARPDAERFEQFVEALNDAIGM
jgi:hypothetical protein